MLFRSLAPEDEVAEGESSPVTPSLDESSTDQEKKL